MRSAVLAPEFDVHPAVRAVLGTSPGPGDAPVPARRTIGRDAPDLHPLIVRSAGSRPGVGPVIVAVDSDRHPGVLLRYGWTVAERLGVPLRVVYVWTDCRPPDCPHHRTCHRDLWDADRLLSTLLDEHLPADAQGHVEREVLHGTEAAPALAALSADAALLVVASSSDRPGARGTLGTTTRTLIGRTLCPLAVVPYDAAPVDRPGW